MADLSGATSSHASQGGSTNGTARGTNRIIDKVRDTATAQLTSQKNRATDGLGSISQAVRQSTHQLRDQEHDVIAHYIEQAADQIDRFSQRMRDKDVGELLRDVQQMARRRPALFIGGAFAVGLIGSRFFKSSSHTNEGRTSQVSRGADRTGSGMSVESGVGFYDATMPGDTTLPSDMATPSPTRAPSTRSRRSGQSERA